MLNFENLNKYNFYGVGKYQIPMIVSAKLKTTTEWIGFNFARSQRERNGKSVHFFIDDYQFNSVWNSPDKYIDQFKQYDNVLSPDFSLYTDIPLVIQLYNHYKKHWVGAYMQMNGVNVIPTISWSDERSFIWCFDGEPTNNTLAISTVGTQNNEVSKQRFMLGYREMIKRLKPTEILCYGKIPDEIKKDVLSIGNFCDELVKRRNKKWAEEGQIQAALKTNNH